LPGSVEHWHRGCGDLGIALSQRDIAPGLADRGIGLAPAAVESEQDTAGRTLLQRQPDPLVEMVPHRARRVEAVEADPLVSLPDIERGGLGRSLDQLAQLGPDVLAEVEAAPLERA
jgi:hypothetical protein